MHVGWAFGIPAKSLVQANIQRFTRLGLVVRITEMDIQTRGAGFPTDRRGPLAYQRDY